MDRTPWQWEEGVINSSVLAVTFVMLTLQPTTLGIELMHRKWALTCPYQTVQKWIFQVTSFSSTRQNKELLCLNFFMTFILLEDLFLFPLLELKSRDHWLNFYVISSSCFSIYQSIKMTENLWVLFCFVLLTYSAS